MRVADKSYTIPMCTRNLNAAFVFLLLFWNIHVIHGLFEPGKEYVYSYDVSSSSGVLLPSKAASSWGFHGKLTIQANENFVTMQLQSLKMNIWNGKEEEKENYPDISFNTVELLTPFQVSYRDGLVENFSVETAPVWAINIKRSIAGIMQLDLCNLEKEAAFHSIEKNHYGQCNMEYVVSPNGEKEMLIRKFLDPRTCVGYNHQSWSNVPKMLCPNGDQNPVLKSSERLYTIKKQDSYYRILSAVASGGIYVQPFQSFGEAQFHSTRQTLELISVNVITTKLLTTDFQPTALQHELPNGDLTQGRNAPDKNAIFQTVGRLLDRLSQRLENPGLDTETNNLHNTTISVLLYYLGMLDVADLRTAYNKIAGTSYKEETIRNMFLETLPQIGTKEAALFILEVIQNKKVSDISAIQLLTQLPFHIRKPDIQLLVAVQAFLNLPEKISSEVQNTAILTYGTLIYKACLLYCPYEMLDDYVRLYLDKFTETTDYEKKMIWLEGLSNIQLGRVVEFLEPIASGNNAESRHFRVLAAWASLPTAPLRPDVIYPVYWPILVNRTEHLEMRIAALTLLIVSSPTPSRLISLYWYIHNEPSEHLYNYFYTTVKSMERATHPCYVHIGVIAAQFTRILRQPLNNHLTTGNYLFDYQDAHRKFGAMVHGIVIANPLTNIPEVLYVTFNTYGSGTNINHVSLYVKAEGLLRSLSTYFDGVTRLKDVLNRFRMDQKGNAPVHMEIIARVQDKTVLCLHLNETNISKGMIYLSSLPENLYHIYQNMEFHVNQQRINVPLTMESVQVSDLGTNVRLAVTTTSLFSMRGNFTHTAYGRNNHAILRTSIHGTEVIESYNPLLDVWHGAERAHSIHGYLPINITIGLEERPFISYNTPEEHMKIGLTAHVRTSTTLRGVNIKSKLAELNSKCPELYVVSKTTPSNVQTIDLFNAELPEFGGQAHVNVFDCENVLSRENLVSDVISSHRANYQIWPTMQFVLLGLHFVDYFTYVPPKGSCGLAAYINTFSMQRTQVKFEYVKNKAHHLLSLTHRDMESSNILHQWNLAALYEAPSRTTDILKIKATKVIPGEKVLKVCLEAERQIPWEWDFLSIKPSEPSRLGFNLVWGLSDTAKGKCSGSMIVVNIIGNISQEQILESRQSKWPYDKCRAETKGKSFVPYTRACYETSKELSTLRKYQAIVKYHNVPESLEKLVWKFRAFYDLIGGNSSTNPMPEQFVLSAVFPKDSNTAELSLNKDKVMVEYNYDLINKLLMRTKAHKYLDISVFRILYDTCVITPDYVNSVHNVTHTLDNDRAVLLLGQCYDENPRFALTAESQLRSVNIAVYDETDTIYIMPYQSGGVVYNASIPLPIKSNFEFHSFGSKRVRLDGKSVELMLPNINLFMHWTQDQILVFFPKYILEFSCGLCTLQNTNVGNLYEEI